MKGSISVDNCSQSDLDDLLTRFIVDLPTHRGIPKNQILKDALVDLTKYHSGGSKPSITSFIRVCDCLEICPGKATLMACWVKEQRITYQQAICMLLHREKYEHLFDGFQFGVIKLLEKDQKTI